MRRPSCLLVVSLVAVALWLPTLLRPLEPPSHRAPARAAVPAQNPGRAATASATSAASTSTSADLALHLEGRDYVIALDELYLGGQPAGRRLLAVPAQADLAALLRLAALSSDESPRLVLYPHGAPRHTSTRRIVNPRLDVRLASASSPNPTLQPDLGIVGWSRPSYAPDHAIATVVGDPAQPLRAAAAAAFLPGVRSARPLLARQHAKHLIPNDPLFKDQWHLRNIGQQGGTVGSDIRATYAWDLATGAGVRIGIVDDGLDQSHPDLAPAVDRSLGYDWNDDDLDPSPVLDETENQSGDDHGTAVAGLAAARGNNGVGLAGVAPAATLVGLRLISAETDDSEDAEALTRRNDVIAIKNCSWGPGGADPSLGIPPFINPVGPLLAAAFADSVTTGRGGRGTLIFFSSANGQANGDQGPLNGIASDRHVFAIGATTDKSTVATFSEGGPHLVAVAPGDASIGVVTTDRSGDAGYNSTEYGYPGDYVTEIDYTKSFGGTSAAAPIASGVAALLLEARPDLGWRDVKEILLRSSIQLQSGSGDWVSRPSGDVAHPIRHHPRWGGGLINAFAALQLASGWQPLAPEAAVLAAPLLAVSIPDGKGVVSHSFALPVDASLLRVEHVVLTLAITHLYPGDLEISLTSPSGVVSRFTSPSTQLVGSENPEDPAYDDYPFTSIRHWGETSALPAVPGAKWTLTIRDAYPDDVGVLHSARLALYGTALLKPSAPPIPAQGVATGSTLVLRPIFTGGDLTFQWSFNGKPIKGATASEYRLANFTAKAAGAYTCTATNAAGSVTIGPANVTLNDSPRETWVSRVGATAAFTVPAAERPASGKLTGLPAGLTFDRVTGRIVGLPTRAGTSLLVLSSTAADGVVTRRPVAIEIAPVTTVGTWRHEGIVPRDPTLNADLGGLLAVTLDGATGRATGTLRLGTASHSFSGTFAGPLVNAPAMVATILRGKSAALTVSLTIGNDNTLAGTVSDGTRTLAVSSGRVPWGKANPVPTLVAGAHTFCLYASLDQPSSAISPADLPAGYGVGTLTIAADGKATWLLLTADGAPALTGTSYVRADESIALYAPALTPAGSTLGDVTLQSGVVGGDLTWRRAPSAKAGLYAYLEGIPLHALEATGGRHLPKGKNIHLFGTTGGDLKLVVTLLPQGATTPLALPPDVFITPANRLRFGATTPAVLTLVGTDATGRLSGTMRLPSVSTKAFPLQAVRLPGQSLIAGYFLLPAGTAFGPDPVAGRVEIHPAP